jgi:hypothetical protein
LNSVSIHFKYLNETFEQRAGSMLCYHNFGTSVILSLVPLVEQELHPFRSTWVQSRFSGVRVTRSLALCVCFVDRCFSFSTFSFGHCVVCYSIYGFWLPLWYLRFADSDYLFSIFDLRILITSLVSLIHGFWLPPVGIFKLFLSKFNASDWNRM